MSFTTLDLACRRVFESTFLGPRLEVAWHGGEVYLAEREVLKSNGL